MQLRGIFVILFSLSVFASAEEIKYKVCKSPSGNVSMVEVTPCPYQPCILQVGQEYNIQVTFTSFVHSQTSKALVQGILEGKTSPSPYFPNDDGCNSGIKCPIVPGNHRYEITLPVLEEYPVGSLEVKWELRDDTNKNLFCIEFRVSIVD